MAKGVNRLPHYDFRTLSPTDFELLVRDLLAAEYSWRLEAFGHGRDGGVDLRAQPDGKKVIVQCKHYAGSTFQDLRFSAKRELPKIAGEDPDRYLFVTSQNLGKTQKDKLILDLDPWISEPTDLLTQLDLNDLLARHPAVERRNFKLWLASAGILERVVRSGLWERSEALMEDVGDRVKLYVSNRGYDRALAQLEKNHVVVLTGAPGVGKSMLAEMLLLSHWHDGWQVVAVSSNIDEAWDAYRKGEKQIFHYDDFLGQTDISERPKNEDARIVRFMDRVARDPAKRIVMTTRSQILRQTALVSDPISRGNFQVRECVVQLADYGPLERARILYNHLYFSDMPRDARREYVDREFYWSVVNHQNFSPRIIEQVLKQGCSTADILNARMQASLDRPINLWGVMFGSALSEVARRIVLTLITYEVEGVKAETLRASAQSDATPLEYAHALRALEGTFVRIDRPPRLSVALNNSADEMIVSYADPSVRDFVLATLDEHPELALIQIEVAQRLTQIRVLLDYAASTNGGVPKFPSLAAAVTREQNNLYDRVLELIEVELRLIESSKRRGYWTHNPLLGSLSAILPIAVLLMPSRSEELLFKSFHLTEEIMFSHADSEVLEGFARAIVANAKEDLSRFSEILSSTFEAWGRSLYTLDDVAAIEAFVDDFSGRVDPHIHASVRLRAFVEEALRSQLNDLGGNRVSEADDVSLIDEIERTAERFGVEDSLGSDIRWERQSTADHYENEDPDDSRPTSGGGYSSMGASKVSGDERAQIGAMFQELT